MYLRYSDHQHRIAVRSTIYGDALATHHKGKNVCQSPDCPHVVAEQLVGVNLCFDCLKAVNQQLEEYDKLHQPSITIIRNGVILW